MWAFACWKRFPQHSSENYRIISNTSFTSEQYDKSGHIRSHKSCVPRGIPQVTVLAESEKNNI